MGATSEIAGAALLPAREVSGTMLGWLNCRQISPA
jgi:hypothetical protein